MIDMHIHSKYSSCGRDDPFSHIKTAKERGAHVVSLTDHRTLKGQQEAEVAALGFGLKYIRGVELEAVVRVGSEEYMVDILGYGFGKECPNIQMLCDTCQQYLDNRVDRILRGLNRRGISLKRSMLQEPVGPLKIMEWLRAAGMEDGDENAVENLLELAYEEGATCDFSARGVQISDARATIDAIHADGGISIMAHPFRGMKNKGGKDQVWTIVDKMVALGVNGLEIVNKKNDSGMSNEVFAYCFENGLPGTGGTDSHCCDSVASLFIPMPFYQSLRNFSAGRPVWDGRLV